MLLAVAAMAGLLLAMAALRKRLAGWLDGFGPFVRLARWLGDGYWDPAARRIEPGHALAVAD